MKNTAKYAIAAIVGLLGLFYLALPHSAHMGSGIGFGLTHTAHLATGVVLVILAIAIGVMAKKA